MPTTPSRRALGPTAQEADADGANRRAQPSADVYLAQLDAELSRAAVGGARGGRRRFDASRTIFDGPRAARRRYVEYVARPGRKLVLGSVALLAGFYVAQGLTPGFVGQGGYWEYSAGLVSALLVERATREYYSRAPAQRSATLQLVQAAKVGFVYGCVLDALKLGS